MFIATENEDKLYRYISIVMIPPSLSIKNLPHGFRKDGYFNFMNITFADRLQQTYVYLHIFFHIQAMNIHILFSDTFGFH